MGHIKDTCSSLSCILHMIRDKKLSSENDVPETVIADAMALFAQLSGQHLTLLKEHERDEKRLMELQEKCETARDELDEQHSYINYLNTEYDTTPWTSDVLNKMDLSTDSHPTIKAKLDKELRQRRELCEQGKSLEDEVSTLRGVEDETRIELERVKSLMVAMPAPSFLSGISPCAEIVTPVSLPSPLYTLHHLVTATLREQKWAAMNLSVTKNDPLQAVSSLYEGRGDLSDEIWDKLEYDCQLLVLKVRDKTLVFRYHPKMNIISIDHDLPANRLDIICGGDNGLVSPHTSLDFMIRDPSLSTLIASHHIGRVYCWLQELSGIDVITTQQRHPSKLTIPALLEELSQICEM